MDIEQIVERFSGGDYLSYYDRHRPSAPQAMVDRALLYAKMQFANLVVDIGSGTGLSTYIWKDKAASVLGVDPSPDMRRLAESHGDSTTQHIRFAHGMGHDVPVENASADIVSCGQVFHWMETAKTLAEVNRILRPGGVFVVYDCTWPPTFHPDFEHAYNELFMNIDQIASGFNSEIVIGHMKQEHPNNIRDAGYFDIAEETIFHSIEPGSSERFEGILMSQGGVHALLREGFTEEELGLTRFRKSIQSISDIPREMTFDFTSIFAIKKI